MSTSAVRVAVVDDDAAVLESVCFLLDVVGHAAKPFASASAFLAALATERFDCAILDHHMPELTGLELARRLRAAGNDLPIMLISGAMTEQIARAATATGLQGVADKPVSCEQLIGFVEQALAA
jgi:two-component system response regulator FixJ